MEKIGVAKLVEFRRIENKGPKATFMRYVQKSKSESDGSGGDYWVCCTSACAATFWHKDHAYLDDKMHELRGKIVTAKHKLTKDQFQKNIDIMFAMHDFDFKSISPKVVLKKLSLARNIVRIEDLPVQVRPQHIFSYEIDENPQIGGVWFVAKKGGFKKEELGMFATALYHYLTKTFSDEFAVDPDHCVAIDVATVKDVSYTDVLKGQVLDLLKPTINDLKKLLQ